MVGEEDNQLAPVVDVTTEQSVEGQQHQIKY